VILHPAIVALLLTSGLVSIMIVYAAAFGVKILKYWEVTSGNSRQLALERSTYLVSTLVATGLVLQIASLFLYVYTADDLHSRFTGAMCAAGTLNVNSYGYPAFLLKVFDCLLAGVWLIINHADNQAYDYPLIRKKFGFLLVIVPFFLSETILQAAYFLEMNPDIITSCCGSLFSSAQGLIPGDLATLPAGPTMVAFFASLVCVTFSGLRYSITGRGGTVFAILGVAVFPVMVVSLLAFISLYFYELPTHHCPFCILQREYGYVGYVLYATLIGGVIFSAGVGALMPFRSVKSLASVIPVLGKRLAVASIVCYLLFSALSIEKIVTSNLSLVPWK
jgi:hypothetical protein